MGDVDSPNLYQYAGNSPFNYSDPMGLCLGFNDEPCSATADRFSKWIRKKESQGTAEGHGIGSVVQDWVVGSAADAAEMFLADPLRAGQSTGDAIGSGAGAGQIALSVVEDVGRASAFVGPAAGAAKVLGVGGRLGRSASRTLRSADEISDTVRANLAASRNARHSSNLRVSSSATGRRGEGLVTRDLRARGYTDITPVQNASGHGIDLVPRNPTGRLRFFEVKTSAGRRAPALSRAQREGPTPFVTSRLERAIAGDGPWGRLDPALRAKAEDLLEEILETGIAQGIRVGVTNVGRATRQIRYRRWGDLP